MHVRSPSRSVLRLAAWLVLLLAGLVILLSWGEKHRPPTRSDLFPPESPASLAADRRSESAPHRLPAAVPAISLAGEAATDSLTNTGPYASLGATLQTARYAAEKIDPTGPHSRGAEYFAANPRQQLRAWFSSHGIELASGRPTPEGETPWYLKFKLGAVERIDTADQGARALSRLPEPPGESRPVSAVASRVEIGHADAGLTEWYENKAEGIEQGFTLHRRPQGQHHEVRLWLSVESDLQARELDHELRFGRSGQDIVQYSKLIVYDAANEPLAARMELHGKDIALCFNDAGAQYPVTIDPSIRLEFADTFTGDPGGSDSFGLALAVNADTAVVGAPADARPVGANAGSVYVFTRNDAGWSKQRLFPNDAAAGDRFGTSVAVKGDTLIVGAPLADPNAKADSGAAYIFDRAGTVWTQRPRLTAGIAAAGDQFGSAVALVLPWAFIGAPRNDAPSLPDAGSVSAFLFNGTAWTEQQRLTAGDASAGATFGSTLAASGDSVLIGAPNANAATGRAYVFLNTSGTWVQDAGFLPPGFVPTSGGGFGSAVALEGDIAVIGAPIAAKAWLFDRQTGPWALRASLIPEDFNPVPPLFGSSVAISGDLVLVGAPNPNPEGSVSVFLTSGEFDDAFVGDRDAFSGYSVGTALAVDGNAVLVAGSGFFGQGSNVLLVTPFFIDTNAGFTLTNSPIGGTSASLRVNIFPTEIRPSVHWYLGSTGATRNSGDTLNGLVTPVAYITFSSYPGMAIPLIEEGEISLTSGQLTTVTATYQGIYVQPKNKSVSAFSPAAFSVSYRGTTNATYQWKRNGTEISGATSSSYTVPSATAASAGTYTVAIEDDRLSPSSQLFNRTSRGAVLTVNPAPQTITFDLAPTRVLAEGAFPVSATASSGLAVTLSVLSGPATLAGNTITPTALGLVTIRATQGGTADYSPAPTLDRTFQVIATDTFGNWRDRYFTAAEAANTSVSGPTADFDRDGANHLLEYACNLLPKTSDATMLNSDRGLPTPQAVLVSLQRRLALQYIRRKAANNPGITYRVEFTSNLPNAASWSQTGTETSVTSINSIWERVLITDSQPANPGRFGRLQVTMP